MFLKKNDTPFLMSQRLTGRERVGGRGRERQRQREKQTQRKIETERQRQRARDRERERRGEGVGVDLIIQRNKLHCQQGTVRFRDAGLRPVEICHTNKHKINHIGEGIIRDEG